MNGPHGLTDVEFLEDAFPGAVLSARFTVYIGKGKDNKPQPEGIITLYDHNQYPVADAYVLHRDEAADAALWLATLVATQHSLSLEQYTFFMG